jgi:hypothetical protein
MPHNSKDPTINEIENKELNLAIKDDTLRDTHSQLSDG